jgi:hypothetical protein
MRQGGHRDAGARAGRGAENCPHCKHELSDAWIKAAHSRVAGRQGGRPRVLRLCPYCREKFGGRELREHIPRCAKAPKSTALKSAANSGGKAVAAKRVPGNAPNRRSKKA